jgi:hypothetical protein
MREGNCAVSEGDGERRGVCQDFAHLAVTLDGLPWRHRRPGLHGLLGLLDGRLAFA